MDTFER